MRKETINWDELTQRIKIKFTFENESPLVDGNFHAIKNEVFSVEGSMDVVLMCSANLL
jgi:hypothetical protein